MKAEEPLVTGVAATVIATSDEAAGRALYQEALEWDEVVSAAIPAATVEACWGVATPARVTVLASRDVPTGRVHLLTLDGVTPPSLGHPGPWTVGFHGVNCYVRDMEEAAARSARVGFPVTGTSEWIVDSPDGPVHVHQARLAGPDDVEVVFVASSVPRYTAAWSRDPEAFSTELTSVILGTDDVDREKSFWGEEGLGLPMAYDTVVSQPSLNRMVGLPEDAALRLAFGMGATTARVEILGRTDDGYGHLPSPDLTHAQRPGAAVGQVAWIVEVGDLERALLRAQVRGGDVVAAPLAVDDAVHGRRRKAVVSAPAGMWIEMWERPG